MRCTIAGYSFDLIASEVERALRGVKPELVSGESVRIGRHSYPIKQVGAVITRQDRRDFSTAEVSRALQRLGFVCTKPAAPEPVAMFEDLPLVAQAEPVAAPPSQVAPQAASMPAPLPSSVGFLDAAH
ncbi:SCO5918 family protein [Streptomyces sp. NPDC092296]|uniref:SCO5918 family protein n=1 Tax=Streptomyces sp. NPDC092296 TaxID=3366012 RepID=UPI003826B1E9